MAYTNIDDPSAYFQIATYTGNGTDNTAITYDGNSDMQPDFLWFKLRSTTGNHVLLDSSRGSSKYLRSNTTAAESTTDTLLKSFDSDGFTVGDSASTNYNTYTLASWGWKANGGTTASNSDGSLTSTVQANQDAGFSIVQWTGAGGARTVGHGLGVAPDVIIVKNRSTSTQWGVWHKDLADTDNNLRINSNSAEIDDALWNDTVPTSSVFSISAAAEVSNDSIAYCFAEKQGYSKFGKYVGNGNDNGPFVYTGFKPAWIMVKNIDSGVDHWHIIDNKRNPNNVAGKLLFADLSSAEITYTTEVLFDILSNGFKLRGDYDHINKSGETIIYMAFAENPFTTSTGIPTTAR